MESLGELRGEKLLTNAISDKKNIQLKEFHLKF